MLGIESQNVVVWAIVVTAVVYLVSRTLSQILRRKSGCSTGCATCPTQEKPTKTAGDASLVSLEDLTSSGQRIRKSK